MPLGYQFPTYATNVDQLFGNEFRQRQQPIEDALRMRQIAAQESIANAQLQAAVEDRRRAALFQQQELASREKAEADRNKITMRGQDITKEYQTGLIAKPVTRSQQEIDEANKTSEAIASQLNAHWNAQNTASKTNLDQLKQSEIDAMAWYKGDFDKAAGKKTIEDKYDKLKRDAEDTEFNNFMQMVTRYYPAGTFKVDPFSKTFSPVRLGPAASQPAAPLGTGGPPGTAPGALPSSPAGSNPSALGRTLSGNPAALGVFPSQEVPAAPESPSFSPGPFTPIVRNAPAVTAPTMVQIPGPAGRMYEMADTDKADLVTRLAATPDADRPAFLTDWLRTMLSSGRVRMTGMAPGGAPAGFGSPTAIVHP